MAAEVSGTLASCAFGAEVDDATGISVTMVCDVGHEASTLIGDKDPV